MADNGDQIFEAIRRDLPRPLEEYRIVLLGGSEEIRGKLEVMLAGVMGVGPSNESRPFEYIINLGWFEERYRNGQSKK